MPVFLRSELMRSKKPLCAAMNPACKTARAQLTKISSDCLRGYAETRDQRFNIHLAGGAKLINDLLLSVIQCHYSLSHPILGRKFVCAFNISLDEKAIENFRLYSLIVHSNIK